MTLISKMLAFAGLAFALSSCKEIKVTNGEVPDEYRSMAAPYMGTYAGAMDNGKGVMTLALQGRRVVLTYKAADGSNDMLDPRCESRIGKLQTVRVSKAGTDPAGNKIYKLDSATFAFDPNRCWGSVDGRAVTLDFSKKAARTRIAASILIREDFRRDCRIDPGNPRAGVPPHEICDQFPISTYANGLFQK